MTESHEDQDRLEEAIEESLDGVRLQEIDQEVEQKPSDPNLHIGTVIGVSDSVLIVELGPRSQGAVPLEEFEGEPPAAGSKVKVTIRGRDDDLLMLSVRDAKALAAWDDMREGSQVKVSFIGVNKGGLEGKIGKVNAFMPASQISMTRVDDLAEYAGQTLICEVVEINRERKRVVVSRRAVLEAEAARAREEGMGRLVPGNVQRGKVVRMESYGAFVDLGHGIEGMVHVSNMSHRRVGHPSEVVNIGKEVEVQILEISEGGRRIGLGMKQLEADPWDTVPSRFPPDTVFNGKVRRLADFGAFVELVPGVEGLLHVSQLGQGHVRHAREVLKEGEELTVRVTKMDASARRVSLSRFDPHGALLGSADAADGAVIEEVISKSQSTIGTNLGALFKKALNKDE
ncbi:MAG: S1 RNA-binding domain-containing protein [Planctomycetota bacterium]